MLSEMNQVLFRDFRVALGCLADAAYFAEHKNMLVFSCSTVPPRSPYVGNLVLERVHELHRSGLENGICESLGGMRAYALSNDGFPDDEDQMTTIAK